MKRSAQSGFALPGALLALLLLSVALALVAASLQLRMGLVQREAQTVTLVALSDAALAETLANLTYDADYPGVRNRDFGGGRIASDVLRYSAQSFRVTATALYARRERVVEADVSRPIGRTAQVIRWRVVREGEEEE